MRVQECTEQTQTQGKDKQEEKMKSQTAVKVTNGHTGKKKHERILLSQGKEVQCAPTFSLEASEGIND